MTDTQRLEDRAAALQERLEHIAKTVGEIFKEEPPDAWTALGQRIHDLHEPERRLAEQVVEGLIANAESRFEEGIEYGKATAKPVNVQRHTVVPAGSTAEVVRAERFELVDKRGRVRAIVGDIHRGTFGVRLLTEDGGLAASLEVTDRDSDIGESADLYLACRGDIDLTISSDPHNGPHIIYGPDRDDGQKCRGLTIDRRGVMHGDHWITT